MATVRVDYYGMEGQGKNVTEAKRDAGGKIAKALDGDYKPVILQSRGWAIMLYREPRYGWTSATIMDSGEWRANHGGSSYGSGDYHETLCASLSHLAQMTWDGKEEYPPCLKECVELDKLRRSDRDTMGRRLLADFKSWRCFQLAYKSAHAQSLPEGERHQWACWNAHKFADVVPDSADASDRLLAQSA